MVYSFKKLKLFVSLQRLIIISIIIFYIILSDLIYSLWLHPNFNYFGYHLKIVPIYLLLFTHFFALIPSFWIPISLKRPSHSIFWFFYLLLYIPSQLFPVYIGLNNNSDLLQLSITLFLSIHIIGMSYLFKLIRIKPILRLSEKQFDFILYTICIISIIYLIKIYGNSLDFVGYNDIYSFRLKNVKLAQGTLAGYVVLALGSSIFPIIMARGLLNKKKYQILFSILGQIFLFTTQGAKSYLLAPLILLFVFFVVRNNERFGIKISKYLTFFFLFLLIAGTSFPFANTGIGFYFISEMLVRTFSIEGLLTAQYYGFFVDHPYTYYTHINIIGKFFTYPYGDLPIGKIIGYEYTGNHLVNSNASFIATDGIAAFGLNGILIISIICALVFYIIDSISDTLCIKFTSIALAFIALNLLNSSLFSTLLSGGLILTMLLFNIAPKSNVIRI